ncbi:MAG TPA: [NiFe]-hydrogenase assembly chaperone HybE [Burkholderiaceae bacterium]|nr:[NiFe]-hydrogenase assembly chaperone HybE [Burkholderiaceae bacterium]
MTEVLLPDPSARLVAAYRAVCSRMEGLAFVNPAVEVEAVGFAPWQGYWLGVMVTPWFINLMLLPRVEAAWTSLPQGKAQRYQFPAGDYDFIASHNEDIGEYQMCSLLSPVLEFADHATARLVAGLARAALLDPANAPTPEEPGSDAERPLARIDERTRAPMSKRDFLRGRFLRDDPDAARR